MAIRGRPAALHQLPHEDKTSHLQALHCLEACLEDVRVRMVANKLKLNEDKTEFMVITSQHYHTLYQHVGPLLSKGVEVIKATAALRNLGVTFHLYRGPQSLVTTVNTTLQYYKYRQVRDTPVATLTSVLLKLAEYS